jgi:hypothetical protein
VPNIITAAEVLRKAPTGFNFEERKITPHIFRAEIKHIKTFLGKDYYDYLVTAANGNASDNLTGDDKAFWDLMLQELISYAVMYESLIFSHLQVVNKGIVKNSSPQTGSESANSQDVNLLRAQYHDAIKSLQEAADCWLRDQFQESDKYPLYAGNTCGGSVTKRAIMNPLGILGLGEDDD